MRRNIIKKDKGSSILKNLMRKVKAQTGFTETIINPEGEVSISDAISKMIAPYRDAAPHYDSFKKLVASACAAWNATLLPAAERESMLADMRNLMSDPQSREDFTAMVTELMQRKKKLYPKVNRMIVQYKVTNQRNDYHIAIASTLEKKRGQK